MALVVKNLSASARNKRCELNPWVGKIPWRRKWQPTPVFLPGKSHGQRSLAGYSPWGHRESDTTEDTCMYNAIYSFCHARNPRASDGHRSRGSPGIPSSLGRREGRALDWPYPALPGQGNPPYTHFSTRRQSSDKFQNEAGQRLTEFCIENALIIANTFFQQHRR